MMIETQASIAGSTFFRGATDVIGRLKPGSPLLLRREPTNKYDANAVAIYWGSSQLGYLPRGLAAEIAPVLDAGTTIQVQKAGGKWATEWGVITLFYQQPGEQKW